ncbi:ParB/RepB/Spo0J family partition protein [Candidatus Xianfuyuplasma coldseepsis]|uniref:ParB/RepB/Spo0J family partition protein n=1 Tax=Candidatus Xianfuyuplasma coldseepsis TaxID=2782163 RepID=A0A7L7KS54_9MOLU|nr:ParB/RepB/Spo0J family partition protein [Xianfuyuplasma coldseepsis]QMS85036.1 ParB/RepB/Spo0J family partition protein [Xianfuyuplasma coldseepsis]
MKDSKVELGRSFKDLMEENQQEYSDREEVQDIDISLIVPNPNQPRSIFDTTSLQELANSIKEHGVFQPVILKPAGTGYMIVAGERRVKAAKLAGLTYVPSIIRDYNSIYLSELAILENLQREDLTPIEEAIALQKALFQLGVTHAELGKKIGKSRVYVTNIIGLLNLPATVIQSVNYGHIKMGHARALSKVKDQRLCLDLHDRIIEEKFTVRDVERIIRNIHSKKISVPNKVIKNRRQYLENIIDDSIKFTLGKAQLTFRFDTEEELNKIIDLLNGGSKQ